MNALRKLKTAAVHRYRAIYVPVAAFCLRWQAMFH